MLSDRSVAETQPTTLHASFEAAVRANADRVALIGNDETLTYRELLSRVTLLAKSLQQWGAGPDVPIGLCVDRSIELIVGMLAILRSGAAYVPIDPDYPSSRIQFLLADAAPPIVVTVSRVAHRLPKTAAHVVCIDAELPSESALEGHVRRESDDDDGSNLAYIMYTSGSTGVPKGVQVEHRNVLRLFAATQPIFGFGERDVWTLFHSFAFDFSVWEIFGALLHGGQLVIVPYEVTRSPERFYALLAERHVTILNQTPSAFRGIVAHDARDPRPLDLRWTIFGGEALDARMLRPWIARHGDERPQLANMYGITETTVHATYRRIVAADAQSGASPIGMPLADLAALVLDERGVPVPAGLPGELFICGAGVARGYLNRPELTAERFLTLPQTPTRSYRSGDRVAWADGELQYLGRIDGQIKVRGFRIEPREIEAVVVQHAAVDRVAVVARDYGEGDVRLVAFVIPAHAQPLLKDATDGLTRDLSDLVATHLPAHMRPSSYRFVSAFPLTAHGKIDVAALVGDVADAAAAAVDSAPAVLRSIWCAVLEVADIADDDDFFDLGGTSLAMIRMLGSVNAAFDVALEPSVLLEAATIRALLAAIPLRSSTNQPLEARSC